MVSELTPERVTRDTLWGGALVFWQPARGAGYRFNLDPVLLSGFVPPAKHILDLGAGCGIVAGLLLAQDKAERVTCVEIQPSLAALALRNAEENGVEERTDVLTGDLRELDIPKADTVVFNPPYFRVGEGRTSPEPGRDIARRERHGTLRDFVRHGFDALDGTGSLYCIVRSDRGPELDRIAAACGGTVVRTRPVAPRAGAEARHVLVEAKNERGLPRQDEAPLVVHEGEGYSPEVRALLRA
ncbi:MAG: methyltransferase [Myxococcota bacterium]